MEKEEVKKGASEKEKKFIKLANYHLTGFITDAELKKLVQEKVIDEKALIDIVLHSESSYVVESAARILSGIRKENGENITSALIIASLPVEGILTERQKKIAEMAKQRPDFLKIKEQLLKAV